MTLRQEDIDDQNQAGHAEHEDLGGGEHEIGHYKTHEHSRSGLLLIESFI